MVVQPEHSRIGTTTFTAVIAPECSGIEGAALLVVFLILWLFLFRKEVRFPQALLLIPGGIALLLFLNAVRIAVLIIIGNAGWRDIATQGFHSQGGWIAFNTVAFGISVGARRIPWVAKRSFHEQLVPSSRTGRNAVSIYLLPFLALLFGGMLAKAVSGKFEWFYGLRLLFTLPVLWLFRRDYLRLPRKWDWAAAAVGIAVFVMWVGIDRSIFPAPAAAQPLELTNASGAVQAVWILMRALTAIVVVPFAEELAFRGYLMRRFAGEDFESMPPRAAGWFAVLVSSAFFGLMHGSRWIAGIIAGLFYAILYRRTGNLSSPIVSHFVTNLLLTIYVLVFNDWSFW